MYADPTTWSDIEKYYGETNVKFKEQGDRVFTIDAVSERYISAHHIDDAHNNFPVLIDISEGYDLSYTIPRKACFQFNNNALMIYRIPAKQWKKGACNSNCGFSSLGNGWSSLTYCTKLLQSYCNKNTYCTVDDLKKPNYKSFAFNHRLSLNVAEKLFLDSNHIGFYSNGKLKTHPLYFQYISKILPVTETEDFYVGT